MGRPYAEVIGDPIDHSKSPLIHNFWLAKLGLPYEFRRTRVRRGQLGAFLQHRRADTDWCGCSVTLPHKADALGHVDEYSRLVAKIGAANCLTRIGTTDRKIVAHNTDWSGFLEPLEPWFKEEATYRLATVIGAGGAAAAASYALDRSGFPVISVNRDLGKAFAMRRRLDLFDDDLVMDLGSLEIPAETRAGSRDGAQDLLVNATPLGMAGFPPLRLDLSRLSPGTAVCDLVYHPIETDLLRQARHRGLRVFDGLGMLIGQAAAAFALFFVESAPREHDAELRELLTR